MSGHPASTVLYSEDLMVDDAGFTAHVYEDEA
jgi:hypothetical protein